MWLANDLNYSTNYSFLVPWLLIDEEIINNMTNSICGLSFNLDIPHVVTT